MQVLERSRSSLSKGKLKNNLFLMRAEKRWTQHQVALLVGVSRQTINAIEANKYNPSLILAFKLALLFDKDITDVFSYQLNEKKEEDNV